MNKTLIADQAGFIRHVLNTAPAIGVDEHGIWLLDLRAGNSRWYVEAYQEEGVWTVLSMTPRDPA
jgi:hypothetical protein